MILLHSSTPLKALSSVKQKDTHHTQESSPRYHLFFHSIPLLCLFFSEKWHEFPFFHIRITQKLASYYIFIIIIDDQDIKNGPTTYNESTRDKFFIYDLKIISDTKVLFAVLLFLFVFSSLVGRVLYVINQKNYYFFDLNCIYYYTSGLQSSKRTIVQVNRELIYVNHI